MNHSTQPSLHEGALGIAFECNILKEKMQKAAEQCGCALLHYYSKAGNTAQEKKMKYMLKDLLYLKKEEAEYICEEIYDEANTHLASAMKYGYAPKDLAELRAFIEEYKGKIKFQQQVSEGKKPVFEIRLGR